MRRERSAAALQRDVLALARSTQSADSSSCVDGAGERYERFHSACAAWLATNTLPHRHPSQQQQQQQHQQSSALWTQLQALTQWAGSGRRESRALVDAAVQIGTRRRRSSSSSCSGAGEVAAAAECVAAWLLHASGLLRLEDVTLGIATSESAAAARSWVAAPTHFLLSRTPLRLPRVTWSNGEIVAAAFAGGGGASTTHEMVEALLLYVIRLAFADSGADAAAERTVSGTHSVASRRSMARLVLEELCTFKSAGFSVPTFQVVTKLLARQSAAANSSAGDTGGRHPRVGRFVIPRDRVAAFLQPQLAALVSPNSRAQEEHVHDELVQIFAAYQSCLPTSAFVHIIRQFVFDASARSGSDATSPDDAVSSEPKSVVCGALFHLITSVAASNRDDFVSHVLTLAHELAAEGLQHMNGFVLRQGLELVAAVSSPQGGKDSSTSFAGDAPSGSPSGVERTDCYRVWVREHFGAPDDSDGKRERLDSNPPTSPSLGTYARRCLKQQSKACTLVTSKRQIQFLCAFLLEFDRREYPGGKTASLRFPIARPNHVAAHLSVMKTHQAQFSSGGLIMDFCSQTRSRYLELLQIEQAAAASVGTAKTAETELSGKSPVILARYSAKVRSLVRENIQVYRDTSKLSPQLRQWKMFQPKLWKQELIPCCLDIQFDGLGLPGEVSRDQEEKGEHARRVAEADLLAHVAFTHALAKSSMVSVREYALFLSSAERWLDERREALDELKQRAHKRRRSAMEGEGFERALERVQLEMKVQSNTCSLRRANSSGSDGTLNSLKEAFELRLRTLQDTVPSNSGARASEFEHIASQSMQRLWDDGCVRVLETLGLQQMDTFFAYLVPVLARSIPHNHIPAYPESDPEERRFAKTAAVGASVVEFFVSQSSWTGVDDARSLIEICCVGAAVAALLGQFGVDPGRSDLPRLLQLIDKRCGNYSDAFALRAQRRLTNDHLLHRALFTSTMLRAASALPAESETAWNLKALLRCESLDAEFREFVLWMGTRLIGSTALHTTTTQPHHVAQSELVVPQAARQHPLQVLSDNLSALAQARWIKDVFDPETLTPATLEQVIRLEFRYGLALFGESATLGSERNACSREWLQLELDLIEGLGGARVVAVEDIVEWIIAEILLQTTTTDDSNCGTRELMSIDCAIEVMLLALNDLMHKACSRQGSIQESRDATTSSHDRILAFYIDLVTRLIHKTDGALPINRKLQHHSFEVLEICSRHCGRVESKLERVFTQGGFAQLLLAIGAHFKERFPCSLLQALFFYLMQAMVAIRDTQAPTLDIHAIPDTIIVRCALEFPSLEKVFERRRTSKNGVGRYQEAFIEHLRRLHSIIDQISRPADSQDTSITKLPLGLNEVFPVEADWTRFQIRVVKLLFSWNAIQLPDAVLEPHLLFSFCPQMAKRVLRVLGVDLERGPTVAAGTARNGDKLGDLALCFVGEWVNSVVGAQPKSIASEEAADVGFQLLLIHAVAEACQHSANVCKKVLLAWHDAPASAVDGAALFIVLLGISLNNNGDSLGKILDMNASLWLNEFSQAALHVHSMSTSSRETPMTNTIASQISSVIANTQSFEDQLLRVLIKILNHGIANQVDVIDAAVPFRIQRAWPRLQDIASRLPVLLHLDEPSEY